MNDKCMENYSFLFLLNAMFMCEILICMNTWMHDGKPFWFLYFLFFLSLFPFSSIFLESTCFLWNHQIHVYFRFLFFLLLIFLFSTLYFRKMGMSQILKPNFKIMFICLTFPFSTLMHACLIMDWWKTWRICEKKLVEIETTLCMLLLTIFSWR